MQSGNNFFARQEAYSCKYKSLDISNALYLRNVLWVLAAAEVKVFFLSLSSSANATPEFEGRGGEELGTEIANTLYRVFSSESSVDLKSLCINPREHCWVIYVDVLVSKEIKTNIQGGFSEH